MHRNKLYILFLALVLVSYGCVKPYDPELSPSEVFKYVVVGQVTDQEGYQEVTVSRASSLGNPKFIPERYSIVYLLDDKGNQKLMEEYSPGHYRVFLTKPEVMPGTSFMVDIYTRNGTHLTSAYEKMAPAPEIDSVYYQRKDVVTNNPSFPRKGIQFYIDFKAGNSSSPYVKWDLEETWEYHTEYPVEAYFDGSMHYVTPYDYSRKVCWKTVAVDEIFTLSTQNIQNSFYRKYPLHFVDNQTSRLAYGYSLLIRQQSLTESAYQYWDKIRINQHNTGGLYQQQPLAAKGNMHNLTRPDEEVLGYFSASAVNTKRIFVSNVPDLEMDYWNFCGGPMDLVQGWQDGASPATPIYLVFVEGSLKVVDEFCVDCLLQNGTNVKPDFWPNKK